MKLANFTVHDQTAYIKTWLSMGFDINSKPCAPVIDFESKKVNEDEILHLVYNALLKIKEEGYNAILIGGMSNIMAYAWYLSENLGLKVIVARTPRKRTEKGYFKFKLKSWVELKTPSQINSLRVPVYKDTHIKYKEVKDGN